jgi:translation initiation factor 2B subunit (eIF-2B alpha/beta/delta family)
MIVSSSKWTNAKHLIDMIKHYGKKMTEAKPLELAIGNTIRRVLCIIREEYTQYEIETEEQQQQQQKQSQKHLQREQQTVLFFFYC